MDNRPPVRAGQLIELLLWPLSLGVAVAAVVRGTSLIFRPTDTVSLVTAQALFPVQGWGAAFLATAVILLVGLGTSRRVAMGGHVVGLLVYLLYAAQLLAASIFFGAPWATIGALTLVMSIHFTALRGYAGKLVPRRGEA